MDKTDCFMVFITAPDMKVAENIMRVLLDEKLAACVNIIDGLKSFFWWDGKIDTSAECQLLVKTTQTHIERIIMRVKKLHPYKVPEIISVKLGPGNHDYLEWIRSSVAAQ